MPTSTGLKCVACPFLREVNRPTDLKILKIFLPGFQIQSKVLTDFQIQQLQQIVDSSSFWARILDFAYNEDIFARISDSTQNFNGGLVNKFKIIMDQQICLPLFTPLLFQSPLLMSTNPPSPFPRLSAQVDPHAKLYHGNLSGTKLVIYKLRCLQASSPRGRGGQNEERNPT